MPWRPVLEGSDADRAREVSDRIAAELVGRDDIDDLTLNKGWAGIALLHGYRALDGDAAAADHAYDALARAMALLDERPTNPWLGTGYLGLAWTMHHLRDVVGVDDDALRPMDELAATLLAQDPWTHEYELLGGLSGVGVYALERGRHDLVALAVAHLDRLAERTPDGVTWWNRDPIDWHPPYINENGYHNLGIGIGVAGTIGFLAVAIDAGAGGPLASGLVADAIRWLTAQERADVRPRYPMCLHLEAPARFVRNSWCYGDAAIACVLTRAGGAVAEPAWQAHARALAQGMAAGPVNDVPYLDLTFCCGLIGRAHLFNRLAQAFDDALLLETSRSYYRRSLDAIATSPMTQPGLKTGWAGVALALLAAISPTEPSWDRAFVVAVPPSP
jgi:hypothetical protein